MSNGNPARINHGIRAIAAVAATLDDDTHQRLLAAHQRASDFSDQMVTIYEHAPVERRAHYVAQAARRAQVMDLIGCALALDPVHLPVDAYPLASAFRSTFSELAAPDRAALAAACTTLIVDALDDGLRTGAVWLYGEMGDVLMEELQEAHR